MLTVISIILVIRTNSTRYFGLSAILAYEIKIKLAQFNCTDDIEPVLEQRFWLDKYRNGTNESKIRTIASWNIVAFRKGQTVRSPLDSEQAWALGYLVCQMIFMTVCVSQF
jgi:hypothetical protein